MSKPARIYQNKVGSYLGKPIYEMIQDQNHRFIFVRIATADADGYPLTQLRPGEVLFAPGLIYRKA